MEKKTYLPFRIPINGRILEVSAQELLQFQGNIHEIIKIIPLRDPKPDEKHFYGMQFKWKGYILRPTEEELKQSGGNLNRLTQMLSTNPESQKRIFEVNQAHKRPHFLVEQTYKNGEKTIMFPSLKMNKLNPLSPMPKVSIAQNNQHNKFPATNYSFLQKGGKH